MDSTARNRPIAWTQSERICVVGLGYVGLPTACMLAVNGVHVLGVDTNRDAIAALRLGEPSTAEPEVRSLLNTALCSGNLELSTGVEPCSAFIIAVPTPVNEDHRPDLSYLRHAVDHVVEVMPRDTLLIVESTVPPGTMTSVVMPAVSNRGLDPESDILLAHCPERVLPGATMVELVSNDRVVGGVNRQSAERAAQLYATFVKGTLHLTDVTTAEMVKVMENTYRDVNIALANEFAKLSEAIGVDVWEAIRLANNHPRVAILKPGPGVGGHCVAVDPWFLVALDPERSRLIRVARAVNDAMPAHVVDRLCREGNLNGGHVTLLGLAYRAELADTRESPALAIYHELRARGLEVRAHDPLVGVQLDGVPNHSLEDAFRGASAIVLATDHVVFRDLDPVGIADLVDGRVVLDTRGCLDRNRWSYAGFRILTLGCAPGRDE